MLKHSQIPNHWFVNYKSLKADFILDLAQSILEGFINIDSLTEESQQYIVC